METRKDAGVISEFVIQNAERKDSGMYACLGANKFGSDEIKLQLMVQGGWKKKVRWYTETPPYLSRLPKPHPEKMLLRR